MWKRSPSREDVMLADRAVDVATIVVVVIVVVMTVPLKGVTNLAVS